MKLIFNVLVILIIIALAIAIIIRAFHRVKVGGRCAACDYDYELKKLKTQHDQAIH